MDKYRKYAVDILNKCQENNNFNLDEILENYKNLESRDFGFIKTLVYGTTRYRLRLDYIIKKLSKIPLRKIDISIMNILRMSLYQLIYMDNIPDSAAINEAVNLAKVFGNRGSSGYVNGSLRNFSRNREKFLEISEDYKKSLSIKYSYPEWIIDEIKKSYGKDKLESVLEYFNKEPEFGIRINSLKFSEDEVIDSLEDNGFKLLKMNNSKYGYIVKNPAGIFSLNIYKEGGFYVQSESSQFVTEKIRDFKDISYILDLCASPGGKITSAYEILEGRGEFLACDINSYKLSIIKENANRLSHKNIRVLKNDAIKFNDSFKENYDLVILDAPCSALGLIRKYPEMKYQKSINDVKSLASMQKKMLDNALKYINENGYIIYSTCSFTIDETINITHNIEDKSVRIIEESLISPDDFNSDGFYRCILKKGE